MKNFIGLLQVALIVLKIMGYITASWFVVLIPIWILLAIITLGILVTSKL